MPNEVWPPAPGAIIEPEVCPESHSSWLKARIKIIWVGSCFVVIKRDVIVQMEKSVCPERHQEVRIDRAW